jgi:predicted nucleic acid-binding protein
MSPVFIDTNILVYADRPHSAFHTIARNALIAFEAAGDEQWISLQVIREYLSVVTRVNPSAAERVPLSPQIAAVAAARFCGPAWRRMPFAARQRKAQGGQKQQTIGAKAPSP